MSKIIEIKKKHVRNLFLSFVLGGIILFGLEHFGKFSYILHSSTTYDEQGRINMISYVSPETKVMLIHYDSFFGNRVTTDGNGFEYKDLAYNDAGFFEYSKKIYYITESLKLDYKYGICISFGLFIITVFLITFKIKLT